MIQRDDDRFRVRPGAPKNRQPRFVSKVLKEVSRVGGAVVRRSGTVPGARLGRGHVTARLAGRSPGPGSRRVVIKARLVNLKQVGPRSMQTHLRYIERDGVGHHGEDGQAYGPTTDLADITAFEVRGREDRHQFRFIVAPEDAVQLDDLSGYTRSLMSRVEADLGTRLDWVAVDHWDTDNPHTHVVLRGRDETGRDLIIAGDYIARGMRERASGLATEWLGPRTELEIRHSQLREVDQERWTSLDRALQRVARGGVIRLESPGGDVRAAQRRALQTGRLERLERMGLAAQAGAGAWALRVDVEVVLRAMGERGDIVRTMQRALGASQRELAVFDPAAGGGPVTGCVVAKGLADELNDRGYLVLDCVDGRAYYLALKAEADLDQFPIGSVVQAQTVVESRRVDSDIRAATRDGVYRVDARRAAAPDVMASAGDGNEGTTAQVRRLEALRRAGIVERIAEGVWRVPSDLPAQGRQYDGKRHGNGLVEVQSHLPIERQIRAIGATWLDRQLLSQTGDIGDLGFGRQVREALRQRVDFLCEQGLAERLGQRVVLARNLLATLRGRDVENAALGIATKTGLTYRPVADGDRVNGIYRRSLTLASGRFAFLEDGKAFSLVPWRPVVEHRLGQTVTGVMRAGNVSWGLSRKRGPSIG